MNYVVVYDDGSSGHQCGSDSLAPLVILGWGHHHCGFIAGCDRGHDVGQEGFACTRLGSVYERQRDRAGNRYPDNWSQHQTKRIGMASVIGEGKIGECFVNNRQRPDYIIGGWMFIDRRHLQARCWLVYHPRGRVVTGISHHRSIWPKEW